MKLGRNEPCSCGSGKKYKNCCLNRKDALEDLNFKTKNDVFLGQSMKDYGPPKLSEDFFNKNSLKELSAARLLYSTLLIPEIDRFASETTRRFITRGDEEAKRISKETNPENLLKMMEQQPDIINHWLLKKRILGFSKITIPKIIEKLKDNQDETFVELAISIIYKSKIDCSSQLLGILDSMKNPYTLSLVCLLLGLIGPRDAIHPVWNYYNFLKDKYTQKYYDQGPLLALYVFNDRFGLN